MESAVVICTVVGTAVVESAVVICTVVSGSVVESAVVICTVVSGSVVESAVVICTVVGAAVDVMTDVNVVARNTASHPSDIVDEVTEYTYAA